MDTGAPLEPMASQRAYRGPHWVFNRMTELNGVAGEAACFCYGIPIGDPTLALHQCP